MYGFLLIIFAPFYYAHLQVIQQNFNTSTQAIDYFIRALGNSTQGADSTSATQNNSPSMGGLRENLDMIRLYLRDATSWCYEYTVSASARTCS